ncbi:MAG: S8 family serine peptidase [Bacteroidota bacterium]
MKKLLYSVLCFWVTVSLVHGQGRDTYWIEFTHKPAGSYSLNQPQAFLGPRSIARRIRQGIALDSTDLPVYAPFVDSLRALGAVVKHTSKWLNGATIRIPNNDSVIRQRILTLPFVRSALPNGRRSAYGTYSPVYKEAADMQVAPSHLPSRTQSPWGASEAQIRLHQGDFLHNQGYRGQGLLVAVFDAGFVSMPQIRAFDSLYVRGGVLDTYDFVDMDPQVYELDGHGTYVMGCLAANLPGELMGTAPMAQYLLYRTENNVGGSENPVEEDNWVVAAERADSLGADVFNSSLIYTTFDVPAWNHPWSAMDGNTSRMTIASDRAAAKGILVVNSAGNYGGGPWFKIGAPADGDSVLAVGATDTLGVRVGFSSMGPSADGRIKPNVMAVGAGAATCAIPGPGTAFVSGTSFAGPIMAGLATCLWQALPNRHAYQLFELLQRSANRANQPDTLNGYGVPNLARALNLAGWQGPPRSTNPNWSWAPQPCPDQSPLRLMGQHIPPGTYTLTWYQTNGQPVFSESLPWPPESGENFVEISKPKPGFYVVNLSGDRYRQNRTCLLLP